MHAHARVQYLVVQPASPPPLVSPIRRILLTRSHDGKGWEQSVAFIQTENNPPKNPEKGVGDLTFLSAMWYNDYDYYNQPVSLTRQGEAG
jgi:hypothetical protein